MAQNQMFVAMIELVLNTPYLYFSYTYDLTHSLQRLHNTMPEFLQVSTFSARLSFSHDLFSPTDAPAREGGREVRLEQVPHPRPGQSARTGQVHLTRDAWL